MSGCALCPGPHRAPPAPGAEGRVSVVVTHYEQPDELARTLAALALQDVAVHEVVVSDDGSAVAPQVPDGVRLVTQPDCGFRAARARQRGAAATTGELLVFLDADTVPGPGLVRALTRLPRTEPDVLVVGRRRHTRFDDGPLDPEDPWRGAEAHELEEPRWLREGWAATADLREADAGSFQFVISALLACGRGWFERVGGFDARMEGYGGEDWDLAHRWWGAGGRLRHEPEAVGWHVGDAAGAGERHEEPTSSRRTAEALAIARRIVAPPVGFHGLRAAPARLLVDHDDGLSDREVVIGVDGLLRDLPQADVVSDRALWRDVGDDRVRPAVGPGGTRAALGLRLHRGVVAEPGAWSALVERGTGGSTALELSDADGRIATLVDLRLLRRVHLGLARRVTTWTDLPAGLRLARGVPLDAWLGGWA